MSVCLSVCPYITMATIYILLFCDFRWIFLCTNGCHMVILCKNYYLHKVGIFNGQRSVRDQLFVYIYIYIHRWIRTLGRR